MQNNPGNPGQADDADPWGALEADLFGNEPTGPAASSETPPPPAFAPEKPVPFERQPEPLRAPAPELTRSPAREEVRAATPSADDFEDEDELDDEDDSEDEDDEESVEEEADDEEDEIDSSEGASAPAAGKKADSYWDALADWNWDETESTSGSGTGGSRSGPPPRSGGHRDSKPGSRPGRPGRSDRGDQGRGRDAGRGRGSAHSGSGSAGSGAAGSGRGERQDRGPRPGHRSPPPSRSEPPAQQRSQSAPPPPSRPEPEEDWDDFGAGLLGGGTAQPASDEARGEREPARGGAPRGSSEEAPADSSDAGKRRRRRRRGGRRGDGPGPAGQRPVAPPHAVPEYNEEGAEEPDLDFPESAEAPPAAAEAQPAPAGGERPSQDRPRGRRRRGGRRDRGERGGDRDRGPATAPRPPAPSREPARDEDFDDDITIRQPANKPTSFEGVSEGTGDEEVEVIDYGDMPTWEEAISYLLHPDQVEVDPTQQSAGAQRRAQAQEQGRSGSRHYGRKNP